MKSEQNRLEKQKRDANERLATISRLTRLEIMAQGRAGWNPSLWQEIKRIRRELNIRT